MKTKIIINQLVFYVLITIGINSFSATFTALQLPINITPQLTDYTYDEDDVFKLVVPAAQQAKYFAFELDIVDGDLELIEESLHLYPSSPQWQWHYPTDSYRNMYAENAPFDLYFQIDNVDMHPTDYAKIRFRWKWHTDPFELEDMTTWEGSAYFFVNINDPTVTTPALVCYAGGGTVTISGEPGFLDEVKWYKSSNLEFVGTRYDSPITVRAASTSTSGIAWVEPRYVIDEPGDEYVLICNKIYFWAGKPGQPTTNPSGYPTVQMELDEIRTIYVASSPGANNYLWSATGSIERLSSQTAAYMTVEATDEGSGNFYCYGTNTCGTGNAGGGAVWVSDEGGGQLRAPMTIKPIPADSYVEIIMDETKLVEAGPEMAVQSFDFGSNSFFRIIDRFGIVKLTQQYSGEKLTQINTSQLPAGLYTLQFVTNDKVFSTNIMVSR